MIVNNSKATKLKLDLTYSRITIKPSQDNDFRLIANREKEFSFSEEGSTLVLSQRKRSLASYIVPVLSWRLPTKTELYIPADFNGSITFTNKNGWVMINNLNLTDLELSNRNGKAILTDIKAQTINAVINNGKILPNKIKAENLKLKSKNGKIKGENITAPITEVNTSNGKIVIMNLNSDKVALSAHNGKIVASITGEEKDYAMDIKTHNGKSIIAGKVNTGSFIYRDKEKSKQITAATKNGKVALTFLNKTE